MEAHTKKRKTRIKPLLFCGLCLGFLLCLQSAWAEDISGLNVGKLLGQADFTKILGAAGKDLPADKANADQNERGTNGASSDYLKLQRNKLSKVEKEYRERIEKQNGYGLVNKEDAAMPASRMSLPSVNYDAGAGALPQQGPTAVSPQQAPMAAGKMQLQQLPAGMDPKMTQLSGQMAPQPSPQQTTQQVPLPYAAAPLAMAEASKYDALTAMKLKIKSQLDDLEKIRSPEADELREKLKEQLLGITVLESRYNEKDFQDLQDSVDKTLKNSNDRDLVSQKLLSRSKPVNVSADILQYGYSFFYGELLPLTSLELSTDSDYIVGPGDVVSVSYYGAMNEQKEYKVDGRGTVPFVNDAPVTVGGMSFGAMTKKLKAIVAEKMIGVDISVNITKYRSMRVFLLGDVMLPGPCLVNGMSTVSGALLACGGVDKSGSLRKINVIRNGKRIATLDFYNFLLNGDTSKDPLLKAGDVVFVSSIQNTVAITGEVNRAAIYEFIDGMSLDELINTAGGLRPTSYLQMAQIERIDRNGNILTIDVDLSNKLGAMPIQNGDIVKIYSTVADALEASAIYLIGNVRNQGKRSFTPGMKLADLLDGGAAFMPDTYLDYGVIERESGPGRETEMLRFNLKKLLEGKAGQNLELKSRDKVFIFKSDEFMESEAASVQGLVVKPGRYAVKKGMTVLDLLLTAGGLQKDADLSFAELYREDPVTKVATLFQLNLNDTFAQVMEMNPELQANDRLVVHSTWERNKKSEVTILGEILKPGPYPLASGARVLDLVYAAGGLTEKAYKKEVEITRYKIVNGKEMESSHFEVNLENALRGSATDNILLEKFDQVSIRPISNWGETAYVQLNGEVMFPGKYIVQKGEHLSEVLRRAGGFTSEAFPYGLRFARKSIAEMQKKEFEEMADRLDQETNRLALAPAQLGTEKSVEQKQVMIAGLKGMADKLRETKPSGRLIVEVSRNYENISPEEDIKLEDGDSIHVPAKPDALLVMGAVFNPNAFRFNKSLSIQDYINMAGGFTEQANQAGTNIVKANGEVVPLRGGYFQQQIRLGPGDVIIVPESVERYSSLEFTKDITQILYQLSLTAAGLKSVGVFQ